MPTTATIAIRAEARVRLDIGRLYEEHASFVLALLTRLVGHAGADPEDLMQEVFVVAWKGLDRFHGDDLHPWLSTIAVRIGCAARRRARLRRILSLRAVEQADPGIDWRTPLRALEGRETSRLVYAVLERLSEKRRTVFVLHELQGLTGAEIALILGCPLKTVWTRLFYARRDFLALVDPSMTDDPVLR